MKVSRIFIVCLVVLMSLSAFGASKSKGRGPKAGPPKLAAATSSSYVACYFGNQWEWGTQGDGSYYSMTGEWPSTKIGTVFTTSTDPGTIVQSCMNVKSQKGIGAAFTGAYAAVKNLGSNYAIVNSALIP